MSEIQEQADKKQAEITAQVTDETAAAEQKEKEMLATAGVGASGANRNMLLSGGTETTSKTTVSDIVVISNDVAAIRIASENISTKVDYISETMTLLYNNAFNELSMFEAWRSENNQMLAGMHMGITGIQNEGVSIKNRTSFMRDITASVDNALGNRANMRARGN